MTGPLFCLAFLALFHLGCNSSPCGDGSNGTGTIAEGVFDLTVIDEETHLPICNATVSCPSCLSSGETVHPDGSCEYGLSGYPGKTASVNVVAQGFANATIDIDLAAGACGTPAPAGTKTISLRPECGQTTVHTNGLGQRWPDCTPLGTYASSEAYVACRYYQPDWKVSAHCAIVGCTSEDAGVGTAICTAAVPVSGLSPNRYGACVCWGYSGDAAGHVSQSDGCECPSGADPLWQ